jgi:hypothetical protein
MFKDQIDPTDVHKEIVFWGDPIVMTELGNVVTMRMARDGEDKYDELNSGDLFNLLIGDQQVRMNLGIGQVVAHWKLPFNEIPDEILCGEEFSREYLYPEFRVREGMKEILRNIYGRFDPKKEFHSIIYVYPDEIFEKIVENFDVNPELSGNPDLFVREFLLESYLQQEGETPEEWINRKTETQWVGRGSNLHEEKTLADVFFGFNDSYKALKSRA